MYDTALIKVVNDIRLLFMQAYSAGPVLPSYQISVQPSNFVFGFSVLCVFLWFDYRLFIYLTLPCLTSLTGSDVMVDVVHSNDGVWNSSLGVFVLYDSFNASMDL